MLYRLCDMDHRKGSITTGDFRKLLPAPSFAAYAPSSTDTGTTDSGKQVGMHSMEAE